MSELHAYPPIDPDANQLVAVFGRKGSGKSVNARELFLAWPGDVLKLVIDPTGDADPGPGALTVHQVPKAWPTVKGKPVPVLRVIVAPSSPTYNDDLDRCIGLALYPRAQRVLIWMDEVGEILPVNRTGPNGKTLLHQSRHWNTSAVMAGPRPIGVDVLVLAQADRVILYDLPNPADRKRVSGAIGWPPEKLNTALDALRTEPPHSFLMYVAAEHVLYLCPPLPMSSPDKKAGT